MIFALKYPFHCYRRQLIIRKILKARVQRGATMVQLLIVGLFMRGFFPFRSSLAATSSKIAANISRSYAINGPILRCTSRTMLPQRPGNQRDTPRAIYVLFFTTKNSCLTHSTLKTTISFEVGISKGCVRRTVPTKSLTRPKF